MRHAHLDKWAATSEIMHACITSVWFCAHATLNKAFLAWWVSPVGLPGLYNLEKSLVLDAK